MSMSKTGLIENFVQSMGAFLVEYDGLHPVQLPFFRIHSNFP